MDDYLVKARSDDEVRRLATKLRQFFGVSKSRHVDVLTCARKDSIWTVKGIKRLNYIIVSDVELSTADGRTSFTKDARVIEIKKSVHDAAQLGVGRARNTIAHEFG